MSVPPEIPGLLRRGCARRGQAFVQTEAGMPSPTRRFFSARQGPTSSPR